MPANRNRLPSDRMNDDAEPAFLRRVGGGCGGGEVRGGGVVEGDLHDLVRGGGLGGVGCRRGGRGDGGLSWGWGEGGGLLVVALGVMVVVLEAEDEVDDG